MSIFSFGSLCLPGKGNIYSGKFCSFLTLCFEIHDFSLWRLLCLCLLMFLLLSFVLLWNLFLWFGSLLIVGLQFWGFALFLCKEDSDFLFVIFYFVSLLYVWSQRNWRNRRKRKFIFFIPIVANHTESSNHLFSSWTSVELLLFDTAPKVWEDFSQIRIKKIYK